MRDGNDNLTVDLVGEIGQEKRGRGRPKKAVTVTGRERTAAYRRRLKRAEIDAIGFEEEASTAALLELLKSTIHRLEYPDYERTAEQEKIAQDNASCGISKVLDALRHRYVK